MKKSRFTETQIVAILNEADNSKLKRMFTDLSPENDVGIEGSLAVVS